VITRREFLEAATAAAVPAIAGAAQRADRSSRAARRGRASSFALVDERYIESRGAGAQLAGSGATLLTIPDGDVTQVWLQHLAPAWKRQPLTVTGLTARPALFCLEQLARDYGLRVVYHGEHIVHFEGRTEHRLLRGAQSVGLAPYDLSLAGWLWPTRVAQAMVNPPKRTPGERFGPSAAALNPALPPGATLLTSWIIAAA
jgi:hypothetical protein